MKTSSFDCLRFLSDTEASSWNRILAASLSSTHRCQSMIPLVLTLLRVSWGDTVTPVENHRSKKCMLNINKGKTYKFYYLVLISSNDVNFQVKEW